MTSKNRKACTHCLNTYWTKELNSSMEWVWECTNCGERQPVITRKPKGFYITTALCPILGAYYLTTDGWLSQEEIKGKEGKMCYYRKSKNILFWLNRPPTGTTVETEYTEL